MGGGGIRADREGAVQPPACQQMDASNGCLLPFRWATIRGWAAAAVPSPPFHPSVSCAQAACAQAEPSRCGAVFQQSLSCCVQAVPCKHVAAGVPSFAKGHQAYLPVHRRSLWAAGCMVAAVRMLAWVALLTADQPWLTDNDTAIRGAPINTMRMA